MTRSADPLFHAQFNAIRLAALDYRDPGRGIDGIKLSWSGPDQGVPDYVYEENHILVRDEDAIEVVTPRFLDAQRVQNRGPAGVGVYEIGEPALYTVDRLNAGRSRKVATLNHMVGICPVEMCPADEPVPPPVDAIQDPYPALQTHDGGTGVRVEVIDTGLIDGFDVGHPWLGDVVPRTRTRPWDRGLIGVYVGHGTCVAGVLRCAAPRADLKVTNGFPFAAVGMEDMLADALMDALADKPHIISLSAGAATQDQQPLMALEPFFTELSKPDNPTLLVAAAGNHGTTDRFWPAAYAARNPDAVVSVGALRHDGKGRACFSNYGDWVSVYALGERHVNAFGWGGYAYMNPQRLDLSCRYYPQDRLYPVCTCVTAPPQGAVVAFRGMAQWSGTSFATPLVAGLIATHMSETGQMNARQAAKEVLKRAQPITERGSTTGETITIQTLTDGITVDEP